MPLRTALLLVLLLSIAANAEEPSNPAAAVLQDHIAVKPGDVQWSTCSNALPPGAQCAAIEGELSAPNVLFTYRVKFPPNYRIAPHFHPADEHITVISGTFHLAPGKLFDRGATRAMIAGSFIVMPKGHAHYAWTDAETIVQVHAIGPWGLTYVDPKDDPRLKESN